VKCKHVIPFLAAALLAGTGGAEAASLSSPAASGASLIVGVPRIAPLRDLGRAPSRTPVDLAVQLPYRQASELRHLVEAQRDAASPQYRHFLTPVQFRTYFAPPQTDYQRAVAALVRAGFHVETIPNGTLIRAVGDARLAERYFATQIHLVSPARGTVNYMNVRPATVPRELGAAHVEGLDNIVRMRVASSVGSHQPRQLARVHGPLFGPDGGFGPLGVAQTEDMPVQHGYTGANVNVADLIDGVVSDSDVATFLGEFGIKRSGPRTTHIRVDGGCSAGTFGCFDNFPATLDAEWALAMAPGASMFTYEVPSLSSASILDGLSRIASDDAVNVVNISFGACELNLADLTLAIQPVVAQAAAEGITVESIAFGGANVCGVGLALPQSPADLDTVTAIGGSSVFADKNGRLLQESGFSGSNGGVSLIISLPSYQASTPGVDKSGRNVPDVVLPSAVDGSGPSVYFGGAWVGGFQFVNNAPYAGYLATVQEMYGGTPLGNAAPYLYDVFDKHGYGKFFHDITLGCNGSVNGHAVCARPGYDITGGIGSIIGYNLAREFALGPIQPPTHP